MLLTMVCSLFVVCFYIFNLWFGLLFFVFVVVLICRLDDCCWGLLFELFCGD